MFFPYVSTEVAFSLFYYTENAMISINI